MDRTIDRLPSSVQDPLERTLSEIDAAIGLVAAGVAVTVTLCFLDAAEEAAFSGATSAQAAGVAFSLRRDAPGSVSLVVGPRLRHGVRAIGVEPDC